MYLGGCALPKQRDQVNPIEGGKVRILGVVEESHVIGPDDRQVVEETTDSPKQAVAAAPELATAALFQASTFLPNQAIARLEVTLANNAVIHGTGFFFSDRRTIVTAAHMLYPVTGSNAKKKAVSVKVFPAQNGTSMPFPVAVSTTFRPNENWVSPPRGTAYWHFDYGVIRVQRTMIEPFQRTNYVPANHPKATLCGYPVGLTPPFKQWSCTDTIAPATVARVVAHKCDASNGQSGSPMWVKENGVAKAVAIHSRGTTDPNWNVGIKFTQEVESWVLAQFP
jgi:V8-like Glu-specific endopeptidase